MTMEFKITQGLYEKVEKFAEARMSSKKLYNYRGKSSDEKIKEDIIIGTLGEWAVYKILKKQGFNCTRPDMKIYETKRKSFKADLRIANLDKDIHVKSQGTKSIRRYGHSWLLQRSDSLVKSPPLNAIMAFTAVDLESRTVQIKGFCHPRLIKKMDLFEECKVPMFRMTKVALYMESLEQFGIVQKEL